MLGNDNNTLENWKNFLTSIGIPFVVSENVRYDDENDVPIIYLELTLCINEDYCKECHTEEYQKWFITHQSSIDIIFDKDTQKFIGFNSFGE